jgi:hypothetical protein
MVGCITQCALFQIYYFYLTISISSCKFQEVMVLHLLLVALSIRIIFFPNIDKVCSLSVYLISYCLFYFIEVKNSVHYFNYIPDGWLYNAFLCALFQLYSWWLVLLLGVHYFSYIPDGWLYNSVCIISDIRLNTNQSINQPTIRFQR